MRSITRHFPLLLCLLLFCSVTLSTDGVVNYFGISETISFNKLDYKLAWSSHPNDDYYKHEYVPAGDSVEHFHDMVMIDFIKTDLPVKEAVDAQVKTIIERKKTDAVCNYQLLKKSNEFILDFLMSEGNSTVNTIEWNAYRYTNYTDKAGHKGILLFGVSHRCYDEKVMPFLKSLSNYRNNNLKTLGSYTLPEIQIK